MRNLKTINGLSVVKADGFHEHSQITDELLREAICGESHEIEKAFTDGKGRVNITHSFDENIGVTHCIPCPPNSKGVYFKQRGKRPYLSRMVLGSPLPANKLTMVFQKKYDSMLLITAWVGGNAFAELGDIRFFEKSNNPMQSIKESAEFWMNHALVEEQ